MTAWLASTNAVVAICVESVPGGAVAVRSSASQGVGTPAGFDGAGPERSRPVDLRLGERQRSEPPSGVRRGVRGGRAWRRRAASRCPRSPCPHRSRSRRRSCGRRTDRRHRSDRCPPRRRERSEPWSQGPCRRRPGRREDRRRQCAVTAEVTSVSRAIEAGIRLSAHVPSPSSTGRPPAPVSGASRSSLPVASANPAARPVPRAGGPTTSPEPPPPVDDTAAVTVTVAGSVVTTTEADTGQQVALSRVDTARGDRLSTQRSVSMMNRCEVDNSADNSVDNVTTMTPFAVGRRRRPVRHRRPRRRRG